MGGGEASWYYFKTGIKYGAICNLCILWSNVTSTFIVVFVKVNHFVDFVYWAPETFVGMLAYQPPIDQSPFNAGLHGSCSRSPPLYCMNINPLSYTPDSPVTFCQPGFRTLLGGTGQGRPDYPPRSHVPGSGSGRRSCGHKPGQGWLTSFWFLHHYSDCSPPLHYHTHQCSSIWWARNHLFLNRI